MSGPAGGRSSAERLAGYRQGIAANGLGPLGEIVVAGAGLLEDGPRALEALMGQADPPTAVLCYNDLAAIGLLAAATRAGMRVPDDLAVIGYDNIPLSAFCVPALTTVDQPKEQMGRTAVTMCLQALAGEPVRNVVLNGTAGPARLGRPSTLKNHRDTENTETSEDPQCLSHRETRSPWFDLRLPCAAPGWVAALSSVRYFSLGRQPAATSNKGESHIMTSKVRVAIAGVGNCSSSLIQGVRYYRDAKPEDRIPGLMHVDLGGYHVRDVEFVAAFDVDGDKVGKDLSQAIFAGQNNTYKFSDVPELGVTVQRGPTLDGLGKYLRQVITESEAQPVDVAQVFRDAKADVLINYLPVGSEAGARFYAEQALAAGVGFVNCIPVFIAKNPEWRQRFKDAGVPIIGDDIKSQVGATITHRVLTRLFEDRGVRIDRTYQLNFGGNTDFMNMLERSGWRARKSPRPMQ